MSTTFLGMGCVGFSLRIKLGWFCLILHTINTYFSPLLYAPPPHKILEVCPYDVRCLTIRLMHITGLLIILLQWSWWGHDTSVIDIPFYGLTRWKKLNMASWFSHSFRWSMTSRRLASPSANKLRIKQTAHGLTDHRRGPVMDPRLSATVSGGVSMHLITSGAVTQSSYGIFLVLLEFLDTRGLTGKGTTEKCIRYGE